MKSANKIWVKIQMKMLRVALALLTGTATSLPPPPSCSHLQHAYGARGVPRDAVPKTPVSGRFCFFLCGEVEFHWSVKLASSCPSSQKAKERRGKWIRNARKKFVPSFIGVRAPSYHTVHTVI